MEKRSSQSTPDPLALDPRTVTLPAYDRTQPYRWNYDHVPPPPQDIDVPPCLGEWTFCGRPIPSPLGIAAGPLLNGKWILYYAALGFDVLTYKTVRSVARECYPLPNLQPVVAEPLQDAAQALAATNQMQGSWAVSFGMPSMTPDVWRSDITRTRALLPKEKLLSVSAVATPQPDWSLADLAEDFARCARWAVESGADAIETNFSCPNVSTSDGQLYQQPAAASLVARRVREAIGNTPYLIKIGFVADQALADDLLAAIADSADALAMTNCIQATVHSATGQPLFANQPRGIGGEAIRAASIEQISRFATIIRRRGYPTRLIGVGGISQADHVEAYRKAGAECVHLATAAMTNPLTALHIRPKLKAGTL